MTDKDYQALIRLIRSAAEERFYGDITFKLKDGEVYHIVKSQSIKLEDLD